MDGAGSTGMPTVAVDIGATLTRIALVSEGAIVRRVVTQTATLSTDASGVAGGLPPALSRFLEGGSGRVRIVAAGVGIAATVDGHGNIVASPDVVAPLGAELRDAVAAVLEVPVVVENDANVAAVAEHRLGAARGHAHAAVLTLGTNIGLGLIVDGRLYRGAHGAAGEVGLLLAPATTSGGRNGRQREVDAGPLGRSRSRAPDGYAWIEELVGGGALAAASGGIRIFGAAESDQVARAAVARAIEGWALVIADLVVLVDPGIVVLVGGLAVDAAGVLPRLQRRVAELVARSPEVTLGTVGPDAPLFGADLLARAAVAQRAPIDARAGLSAQSIGG
jgi:glucokinase